MSKKFDDVFPGHPTGPNEFEQRQEVEQQDVASLQTELNEQERIGNAQSSPFDHNRVPVERKPG
jgi:hypothetical protein